MGVRI